MPAAADLLCFWIDPETEASADVFQAWCPYDGPPDGIVLEVTRWTDAGAEGLAQKLHGNGAFASVGPDLGARLARAQRIDGVVTSNEAPADLGHLQVAWARAAHAAASGAAAVKDLDSGRVWLAQELLALDPYRRFSPTAEIHVSVVDKTDISEATTTGMSKLGVPELGLRVPQASSFARYWMERALDLAASGEPFEEGDTYPVEGIWIQVVGTHVQEGMAPMRILALGQQSGREPSSARGEIPAWLDPMLRGAALAPFGVGDLELRFMLPAPLAGAPSLVVAASPASPDAVLERIRSGLAEQRFELAETQRPRPEAIIALFELKRKLFGSRESPGAISVVAARAASFPPSPALWALKERLGPDQTLLLLCIGE